MSQEIVIRPTPKNKPGHLLRNKRRMTITKRLESNDPDAVDALVDFILNESVVIAPEGMTTEAIRDSIMGMSQEEYEALF
ncbi:hypothetical protein ACI3PL_21155, partial [Lacticaseibacillus paracasei]